MDTGFKRETLPQDLEAFKSDAAKMTVQVFASGLNCPALVYARSKLWDPLLIMTAKGADEGTRVVSYDLPTGGVSFVSPIRKRITDPKDANIYLGRAAENDVVVPVATVSSRHAHFKAPAPGSTTWTLTDLGSRNGTWINERQLEPMVATPVPDGDYIRLGGNLIAWFLYPSRLWSVLRNPAELSKLIDV